MNNFSLALNIISIYFIPVLLGMICHEVAHGWTALKMGDPTARNLGRLTLNPVAHFDPLGSLVFLITAVASAFTPARFIFGWAKPVPVNYRLFRNFRQGLFAVSIAGAVANVLLAAGFAVLLRLAVFFSSKELSALIYMENSFFINVCTAGILINFTLAYFNLLPIPPLDGSKVLAAVLPSGASRLYFQLERFGIVIVLVLLMTGLLGKALFPLIFWSSEYLLRVVGLSLL